MSIQENEPNIDDLFTEDRPMATVAELAESLDLPVHVVRAAAVDVGAARIGNSLAVTLDTALAVVDELESRGYLAADDEDDDEDEDDPEADEPAGEPTASEDDEDDEAEPDDGDDGDE